MNDTVITVVGRIVNAPKRRHTEAGVSVTNFRVASTARRRDRETQQWVDGDTLYLNVSCWRHLADNVARSVVKGDPVIVHGRVFTRHYELDGQKRQSYDMEAHVVGADLTWGQVEFSRMRKDVVTHDVIDGGVDVATGAAIRDVIGEGIDEVVDEAPEEDTPAEYDDERDLTPALR
ncbi:MAG: single-stranded DNA-binding protein [Geodermatophilaceae bacterium]|nr:single-stranded DNA-binding protein [Geodermatophilaceae bacterium]